MKQKLVALLLSAMLLLSACAPKSDISSEPSGSGQAESRPRRTIPYSEINYQRPAVEELIEQIDALTEELKAAKDFEAAMQLYEDAGTLQEGFNTQYIRGMLGQYHDVTDTFFEEEMRYLSEESLELEQHINLFVKELTEGPFAADFREEVGDHFFESQKMSLLFLDDTVKEYQKERAQLKQDYNKMISSNTVSGNGEEYTVYEIFDVEDPYLYFDLYEGYMEQYAQEYAQLYHRMVELDKLTAYELGFKDAATMYYLMYNRDYSPKDAKKILAGVRKELVPLAGQLYYDDLEVDYQTMMEAMPKALKVFGPEFLEAWDYMQEFGLYDWDFSPNKRQGVAFTCTLDAYDAPFIFANYAGDFDAAETIVHEFGHFYDTWLHYDVDIVQNLDVAETYSQALELLMIRRHGLFTDSPQEGEKYVLSSMLEGTFIWQSVLEDFQLRLYQLEDFDVTSMGQLFGQVMEDYGFDTSYRSAANGVVDDWLLYDTLFESPFYTISYVSSATAAMQIWAASQDDWQAGVDIYQKMIHANQNQPYTQLLAEAGLTAPHARGTMAEIGALYRAEIKKDRASASKYAAA